MGKNAHHPHDRFFRFMFSHVSVFRALLEEFLPQDLLEAFDLDTLQPDETQYISKLLDELASDKVYRCQIRKKPGLGDGEVAALALLLEHKSFIPKYVHLQLLDYRQEIWRNSLKNHQKPPVVFAILLVHGLEPFEEISLADYFLGVPDSLKPYIGDFKFFIIDLTRHSDEKIQALKLGYLASGLLLMKHSKDKRYLIDQFQVLFERGGEFLKTEEGKAFVEGMLVYFSQVSELRRAEMQQMVQKKLITPDMRAATLSLYDNLILEGKIAGKAEGEKIGEARGKMEGKMEGKIEEKRLMAERTLRKFPRWAAKKVADLCDLPEAEVLKIKKRIAAEKAKPTGRNAPKSDKANAKRPASVSK